MVFPKCSKCKKCIIMYEGDLQMITYNVFWKTLKNRNVTQYKLIHEYNISRGLLYRMRKNENISTHTINMLCDILQCDITDIMEYTQE